ncbi:MAG: hypothetical protein LBQ60_21285 [Bacteroidales bacterium]|jgi:hypothetical protein|nr:hypothetical protein [Bacteroidales bacterium]
MNNCVEVIKSKIGYTLQESINSKRSIDDNVNSLLDSILSVRKLTDKANNLLSECINDLYNSKEILAKDGYIQIEPDLISLKKTVSSFYITLRKGSFYPGIKQNVFKYHNTLKELQEFIHDMNLFFIDLPEDDEFKAISKEINLIFKK